MQNRLYNPKEKAKWEKHLWGAEESCEVAGINCPWSRTRSQDKIIAEFFCSLALLKKIILHPSWWHR